MILNETDRHNLLIDGMVHLDWSARGNGLGIFLVARAIYQHSDDVPRIVYDGESSA